MTIFEAPMDGAVVGLEHGETRLRPSWAAILRRVRTGSMIALLVVVQLAWVAALAYFAYLFVEL